MNQPYKLKAEQRLENELLPRSAIARSFGSAADSYDQHAELQRAVADKLLSTLPQNLSDKTILDMGCGTGYCTRLLQQRLPQHLLALDLALPMLNKLKQSEIASALLCADAQSLPLQTASLDLIVSSLTIQWCPELPALFAELARVLKPGGKIFISTFGPASLQEVAAAWRLVDSYTHVNSFVTAASLQQQAAKAGLTCGIQSEIISSHYASLYDLSRELKALGAHNMNRAQAQGLTSPQKFRSAARHFDAGKNTGNKIAVSWEIYYLMLEKHHAKSTAT